MGSEPLPDQGIGDTGVVGRAVQKGAYTVVQYKIFHKMDQLLI